MSITSEKQMIQKLSSHWKEEYPIILTELFIPIIDGIHDHNYLEGRNYIRIDMAVFDQEKDEIIFVEAERGLFTQHPVIYLPFCNRLYLLCPYDDAPYREEQLNWCKKYGIGLLEIMPDGEIVETLRAVQRPMFPAINNYIKSRIIKKAQKSV